MTTLQSETETEITTDQATGFAPATVAPELNVEQTPDGAFRRQRNWFNGRFGSGEGQAPAQPGRYRLLGSVGCGWARRQLIVLRLLGLSEAVPFELLYGRDDQGWKIARNGGDVVERFGTERLNDFYARTDPGFRGRGTSPTVIDVETGQVVTNNYHALSIDFETVWKPFHAAGAADLYPVELRPEIDLLNQQLFDDVNNGTYKVIFAAHPTAAQVALGVFEARLADYDFRLASRRYLFGDRLTDSDVRLFVTLSSYERSYRPRLAAILGEGNVRHLQSFENLWAYARDLFAQGFADEREQYFLGLVPGPSGRYTSHRGFTGDLPLPDAAEALAEWREPAGRDHLAGSPLYSGPGAGGSAELWHFA
jgi:putative glutathione S-transferase